MPNACKPSCHFSVLCSHSELEDLAEKVRCVLCSQQKILSLITDVKFNSKSLLYHSLRIPVLILYACYLFELELQNKYWCCFSFPIWRNLNGTKAPHPRKLLNRSLNPRCLASKTFSSCCYTEAQVVAMATVILVAVDRAKVQAGTKHGTSHLVPVVFLGEQLRGGSLRWHLRQQTRCRWTLLIVILRA